MAKPNIYYVLPWKSASASAKALTEALGGSQTPRRAFRMRLQGSSFTPATHRKVINWGNSGGFPAPYVANAPDGARALNGDPVAMVRAGNKLAWFRWCEEREGAPRIPDFTEAGGEALLWRQEDPNLTIVSRLTLTGHSGSGIVVTPPGEGPAPDAPLYVKYIPKDAEFRVHLFRTEPNGSGAVIDIQKKVRDPNKEPTSWKVRSHQNGFMFIRNGFDTPPDVIEQARRAFQVSGLDFAAVDVIWNAHRGKAYVLELNTAPGLEGQSVEVYANAIKRYFGE